MKEDGYSLAMCFGEVLFDLFPTGPQPGGAPLNVAVQLQNLGISTTIISAIGNDNYGRQLTSFLQEKKVNTDLLQVINGKDTGTVRVNVDRNGDPTYTIIEGVAWDFIDDSFLKEDIQAKYLIHGSLACRSVASQASLEKLIKSTQAKVVFDLNIRSPFYSKSLIDNLLSSAHIVKMSEEEFDMLKRWYYIKNSREVADLRALKYLFENLEIILVTKGNKGAIAWQGGKVATQKSIPVKTVDTVGSGDAFLSAFLSKYDQQLPLKECLEFAVAAGTFLATKEGANPVYAENDIRELYAKK